MESQFNRRESDTYLDIDHTRYDIDRHLAILSERRTKKWIPLTRLENSHIHENGVVIMTFSKKMREGGDTRHISLEVACIIKQSFGSAVTCTVQIHPLWAESSDHTGRCFIRLPIVSRVDTKMPHNRAFDDLIKNVGYSLSKEEKDILSEPHLQSIVWIADPRQQIKKSYRTIIERVQCIF